jgi:anaerobic glycerol-3-phosphate dehydrogenase
METAVINIGGGQAGLAAGYFLGAAGSRMSYWIKAAKSVKHGGSGTIRLSCSRRAVTANCPGSP